MMTLTEQQEFWREVAESAVQLETILDLVNDAPELLGDDQTVTGLAVLELASSLHRTRIAAIDRLRDLAALKAR